MTPIYLDYNATTPLDPRVFEAMQPYFLQHFGNASSQSHTWGWAAGKAVTAARESISQYLGCQPRDLFFTSGSTESNNWAILGFLEQERLQNPQAPIHVLTSAVEHQSVLKTIAYAQKLLNIEVDFIDLNEDGTINFESLQKLTKPHTRLISLIWVNNEIGSINDLKKISAWTKARQIILHTDGTQAVGKIPFQLSELDIDLLSLSAHKIYGPKGAGLLYKRPRLELSPRFHGGGQEMGLRSGTLNVPGIVGLGEAIRILSTEDKKDFEHSLLLQKYFWNELQKKIPGIQLNGSPLSNSFLNPTRSASNLSVTFPKGFKGGSFQDPILGVSAGSACHSGSATQSHVLRALCYDPDRISRTLRLSFGRGSTLSQVEEATVRLSQSLAKL